MQVMKIFSFNTLLWLIWDLPGFNLIFRKIVPFKPGEERKITSIGIWVISVYIAAFGLASQRYENRLDVIETRTSIVIAQTGTKALKQALERIPDLQKMRIPIKPNVRNPKSVFFSFFIDGIYERNIEDLNRLVESYKHELDNVNLSGIDLLRADLGGANLTGSNFSEANLVAVDLSKSKLRNTYLCGADLRSADLSNADLSNAILCRVDFRDAKLINANLSGVSFYSRGLINSYYSMGNIEGANFSGVRLDKAIWIDGKKKPVNTICAKGSIGKCIIEKEKDKYIQ